MNLAPRILLALALAVLAARTAGAADPPRAEATAKDFDKAGVHKTADAGHGGDHGGGHGHGDDVNVSPIEFRGDLAIWSFCVFVLLMVVLGKFAWGPISEGLDKREQSIAANIAAAEKAAADAKAMIKQYEQKLAGAQNEVRAIIEEARRDGERTMQELTAKGQAEAQAARDRLLRDVETAKGQALKELAELSTTLAVELAGKLVRAQLKREDHTALISDALDKFRAATAAQQQN
jgi:F-type H+-transporting ATPase subunit b